MAQVCLYVGTIFFFGQICELIHFTLCDGGELKLHAKHAGMDVRFSSVLVKLFNFYVI